MRERRYKSLRVTAELFLDLCKESEYPRVTRVTKNPIPAGAELAGANYDAITGVWRLGVYHHSFDIVPMSEPAPELPLVEVSSSIGEWIRMAERIAKLEAAIAIYREREAQS